MLVFRCPRHVVSVSTLVVPLHLCVKPNTGHFEPLRSDLPPMQSNGISCPSPPLCRTQYKTLWTPAVWPPTNAVRWHKCVSISCPSLPLCKTQYKTLCTPDVTGVLVVSKSRLLYRHFVFFRFLGSVWIFCSEIHKQVLGGNYPETRGNSAFAPEIAILMNINMWIVVHGMRVVLFPRCFKAWLNNVRSFGSSGH